MVRTLKLKDKNLESVSTSDETVILDEASEQYFATNSAGTVLWEALKEGSTKVELSALLIEKFDIDPSRAKSDVHDFVTQLDELEMLET